MILLSSSHPARPLYSKAEIMNANTTTAVTMVTMATSFPSIETAERESAGCSLSCTANQIQFNETRGILEKLHSK